METTFDCVVCGTCVVDILVRPVPLEQSIGRGNLIPVEPIEVTTGGLVSNSGIALARLGMRVAALSYVGEDEWAEVIRRRYAVEGVDAARVITRKDAATSSTAVLIDETGEHSFAHYGGAWRQMDRAFVLDNLDLFASSRFALIGYYSLMHGVESDLPEILAELRRVGCRTALDAAGDGGSLQPLDRILPHLDVYVPSYAEAKQQTGKSDPREMIDVYRACGTEALLGVKLGERGALLSRQGGDLVEIAPVEPPEPLVDTTGAGDSFFAGLLTGLIRGMSVGEAGRLAAATGACCVSAVGASDGIRGFDETVKLAGL